jgi:hypothetical protein
MGTDKGATYDSSVPIRAIRGFILSAPQHRVKSVLPQNFLTLAPPDLSFRAGVR